MQIAITRGVSAAIAACELTHLDRQAIDLDRARAQHRAYETALERSGCRVESLPALDDLPDAVFVEDVAIVLDEIAIVTNPGAESRRPETAHIAPVLANYRRVTFIREPGTLDDGDVLRLGRRIFVGRSGRSDERGIEQLRAVVWPYGFTVTSVPVGGCLHLKSAITEVAPGTVLVNRAWVDPALFDHLLNLAADRQRSRPVVRVWSRLPASADALHLPLWRWTEGYRSQRHHRNSAHLLAHRPESGIMGLGWQLLAWHIPHRRPVSVQLQRSDHDYGKDQAHYHRLQFCCLGNCLQQ